MIPRERFRASVRAGFRLIQAPRATAEECAVWAAEHQEAVALVADADQRAVVATEARRVRERTGRNPWSGEKVDNAPGLR